MESWKKAIDKVADRFDSPETNLDEFLSPDQRHGEFGILADLSDKQVRKQTIEDAKKILEELGEIEI